MIKSVNIVAFGKLQNYSRSFQSDIEVICEQNGWGKSTLTAFIAAMFYGLDAKTRQKYTPWGSVGKFGGSMVFPYKGEEYRITREFGTTPKEDRVQVVNISSGKRVPKMEEGLGQELFGLEYSDFCNSFFIPQEAVQLKSTDTFSAKLSQMTGEAKCDEAKKKLEAQQSELKSKKKQAGNYVGLIPECEKRIAALRDALKKTETTLELIKQSNADVIRLEKELNVLTKQEEELSQKFDDITKQKQRVEMLNSDAKEKIEKRNNQLQALPKCDYEKVTEKIASAKKLIQKLNEKNKIPVIFLIAFIVVSVAAIITVFTKVYVIAAILAAAASVCIAAFAVSTKREKQRKNQIDQEIRDLLYPAEVIDSYSAAIQELRGYYDRYVELISQPIDIGINDSFDYFEYSAIENELKNLKSKIAQKKSEKDIKTGSLQTLKPEYNLEELKEKLTHEEAALNELTKKHVALDMAIQALDLTKTNLSKRYLPKMANILSENIGIITRGKITQVEIEENDAKNPGYSLRPFENGIAREFDNFSKGEKEAALLCLKIALCVSLYGNNIPFVMIDDAFVNFDEMAFEKAFEIIKGLSKTTQVLYFTCHERRQNT